VLEANSFSTTLKNRFWRRFKNRIKDLQIAFNKWSDSITDGSNLPKETRSCFSGDSETYGAEKNLF